MTPLYIAACLFIGLWSAWSCFDARVKDGLLGKLLLAGVALGCVAEVFSAVVGPAPTAGRVLLVVCLAGVGLGHMLDTCRPWCGVERRRDSLGGGSHAAH